jgi:hypothetical protein
MMVLKRTSAPARWEAGEYDASVGMNFPLLGREEDMAMVDGFQ